MRADLILEFLNKFLLSRYPDFLLFLELSLPILHYIPHIFSCCANHFHKVTPLHLSFSLLIDLLSILDQLILLSLDSQSLLLNLRIFPFVPLAQLPRLQDFCLPLGFNLGKQLLVLFFLPFELFELVLLALNESSHVFLLSAPTLALLF